VGDDQDVLALLDVAEDRALEERQGAGGGVLERLAVRRRRGVRPPPDVDLLVAVLRSAVSALFSPWRSP
jgi:hypothetical protein